MGDFTYRTREEVEAWKRQDPILRLRDTLLTEGIADEAQLQAADAEITALVADAQQFAEASPWPDPATAVSHVYYEG
jgi:TPP-dependent pyruvate/acetoin dehydrogenase alpha subunit